MMIGRNHMQRLRKRRGAAMVALYALVLEIIFGAIHAAALAAAAFGPPASPSSFIFQICTPQGVTSIRAIDGRGNESAPASRKSASDFCPVCGSAAVSPFAFASPVTVPPAPRAGSLTEVPEDAQGRSLTAWRLRKIRAPPCCFSS